MKKSIRTLADNKTFYYEGSVEEGTCIFYGDQKSHIRISANDYNRLISYFNGKEVPIGSSRTNPPNNSLGYWLKNNITKTAIASYIAAILVKDGHAKYIGKIGVAYYIKFNNKKISK